MIKQTLTSLWQSSGAQRNGVSKADFWALASVVAAETAINNGRNAPNSK